MTKTETIQTYLKRYPEKGPSELAGLITKETGVEVDASFVSAVKTKMKQAQADAKAKPATKAPAGAPTKGHGVSDHVANLKAAAAALGKDHAKKIIDLLN